ncbi:hypothetical protein Pan258_29600 [Symmachiella dynata]|nr:hypothetical protein Pan258_29600 [Symmachiella dynata]
MGVSEFLEDLVSYLPALQLLQQVLTGGQESVNVPDDADPTTFIWFSYCGWVMVVLATKSFESALCNRSHPIVAIEAYCP